MRIIMYGASLMLIAVTTFLFLSFEIIEQGDMSYSFDEFSLSVPESVAVFSTVAVQLKTPTRNLRSGVVLLKICDNRLWNRSDTVLSLKKISGTLIFNCSFTDTGFKNLECFIISPNNQCRNISQRLVVYSPLKAVIQRLGKDSLILSTPAVNDSVNYVWEFDNGLILYNCAPYITLAKQGCMYHSGKLYVESAQYKSPEVKFHLDRNDDNITIPVITAVPEYKGSTRYVYK
jgi:hypothetical protein